MVQFSEQQAPVLLPHPTLNSTSVFCPTSHLYKHTHRHTHTHTHTHTHYEDSSWPTQHRVCCHMNSNGALQIRKDHAEAKEVLCMGTTPLLSVLPLTHTPGPMTHTFPRARQMVLSLRWATSRGKCPDSHWLPGHPL